MVMLVARAWGAAMDLRAALSGLLAQAEAALRLLPAGWAVLSGRWACAA